jgi:hypothetical protein
MNGAVSDKENRGAALTILRAYHVAGRPNLPPRLQGFEEWPDTVRAALTWLDAGDPVSTMDRLRKADPVLASLTAMRHAWRAALGVSPTPARAAISAADDRLDLHDALMRSPGAVEGSTPCYRQWLSNCADRVVNLSDNLIPDYAAIEASCHKQRVAVGSVGHFPPVHDKTGSVEVRQRCTRARSPRKQLVYKSARHLSVCG